MKALSIRQPWAWLIVQGHKKIENRTWDTKKRGRFLVHASSKRPSDHDMQVAREICDGLNITLPEKHEFVLGSIVGYATVCGTVTQSDDPFFFGPVGIQLKDCRAVEPIRFKGALSFFNTPYCVVGGKVVQSPRC
ncbi:hypothetical protein pEaSNUABM22_00059 [Erwinia phage pEa_SNUABM_22]|uniref:ASCH domain-containing protein n=1 Tax=Erwinia phage pEa_SNUABM_22 TaxID=2869549 RepID=A0AAE8XRD2_9CAUD|nr:hypothetical protein MPK63_gp059 [Erwinia phage pEa_SNUABM_22]UAW96547.1 hypothetical protein pEaSNUABM22_00059 [Erwinia phage pEa_SNUABM_22]